MADKIYHIAVKVPDLDEAKAFYKNVFGFEELKQNKVRDHTSCHLTDGGLDIAVIEYEAEDSPEAGLSGAGACIHHIGVEVDDIDAYQKKLEDAGCKVVSKPGVLPVKFHTPHGVLWEVVPEGYFQKTINRQ
jgi:lactoylglutathione lyase